MAATGSKDTQKPVHWADINAQKIIGQRGDKEEYTCASGITPSGTVHIGNFREIISVELVVRALRDRGAKVRFIYSWDDYDVFRKVPKNLPKQEMLQQYLRWPIVLVPDPWEEVESYARANERRLERILPTVGVEPTYLYQAQRYRNSAYAEGIRRALEYRDTIRGILNQYRSEPLTESWWPVTVFSNFTNTDNTTVLSWDGEYGLTYRCEDSGREETVDLRETGAVKLLWRIDWPMRWRHEDVDFEPAGKEHHSAGGSFDTGKQIAEAVYGIDAPATFKYDFISIKGSGGKISSSSGEVIGLDDVLEIYQPELVRYLFAGTRPNAEFAISFDLDVIKIYEDYDRCERVYFGEEEIGEKRAARERRTYELSQVDGVPQQRPVQIPFRHLCNLLQIAAGDIETAIGNFTDPAKLREEDERRIRQRAECAWNWITRYAPEGFRFYLKNGDEEPVEVSETERAAIRALREELETRYEEHDEKTLAQAIYDIARDAGMEPKDFFTVMYRVLIAKEQGPRLAGFLRTIGKERALRILRAY